MLHIDLFAGTPFRMFRLESVFCTNNFAFKIGGEGGMVVGKTWTRRVRRKGSKKKVTRFQRVRGRTLNTEVAANE